MKKETIIGKYVVIFSMLSLLILVVLAMKMFTNVGVYAATINGEENQGINYGMESEILPSSSGKGSAGKYAKDWNTIDPETIQSSKYIPNSKYFIANPKHADQKNEYNSNGTCTTVAMQLLLGYHNFCTDRRIIPEYGENDIRFLSEDYGYAGEHYLLAIGASPEQGSPYIGTEDGVYDELYESTPNSDGALGQSIGNVCHGARNFIDKYSDPAIRDNVTIWHGIYFRSQAVVEIDAGRPIILVFTKVSSDEQIFHVVVGYGYATIDGEFGYIVHYGWGDKHNYAWVSASHFGFMATMKVAHTHNYEDTGHNVLESENNYTYRELKCSKCGCNTIDDLYEVSGNRIVSVNYPLSGELIIPGSVHGHIINRIGDNAFSGQDITSVVAPLTYGTLEIGDSAFENCSYLTSLSSISLTQGAFESFSSIGERAFRGCPLSGAIYIPFFISRIGDGAFAGCDDLEITVSSESKYYISEGNILYEKPVAYNENGEVIETTEKCRVVHVGKVSKDIELPETVTEIGAYAFEGNSHIQTVRIKSNLSIGESAFADCPNLTEVYFDTYEIPTVCENVFENCLPELSVYVALNYLTDFKEAFSEYADKITSFQFHITFIVDREKEKVVFANHGDNIDNIYLPEKTGYEFGGWYDNFEFTGEKYFNCSIWGRKSGFTFYGYYIAKTYAVTLDPEGGELHGEDTFTVTYGQKFSTTTIATKDNHLLQGWFFNDTRYIDEYGNGTFTWDIDGDVTLRAVWTPYSYEIKIDAGIWKWLGESGVSDDECLIQYGTEMPIEQVFDYFRSLEKYNNLGQVFMYFNDELGNKIEWDTIPALGDNGDTFVIIPVWEKEKYMIIFETACDYVIESKEYSYGDPIELIVPVRAGYEFWGWYLSLDEKSAISWVSMPDLTPNEQSIETKIFHLYAKWEAVTYYIEYDANGGTGTMEHTVHVYGKPSNIRKNTFTKTGYIFSGWSTTSTGKSEYADGTIVTKVTTNNEVVTFYAVWTRIVYIIKYDANGGVGTMKQTNCFYDVTYNLRYNTFTRTGYNFIGWATSATGEVKYIDGQSVSKLATTLNEVIMLYAVWEEIRYNIVYKNLAEGMYVYSPYYTYDKGLPSMPKLFMRNGERDYLVEDFYGWYTSLDFTEQVASIPAKSRTGDLTLYAKYDYFLMKIYDTGITYTVSSSDVGVNPSFDLDIYLGSLNYDKVKDTSLKKIRIEFKMNCSSAFDSSNRGVHLCLKNYSKIWSITLPKNIKTYKDVIELDLSRYQNIDLLRLCFTASNILNQWQLTNFELSVYLTN